MLSQGGIRDAVLPSVLRAARLRLHKHLPSIRDSSLDREGMESCQEAPCPGHHRTRVYCGQLCFRVVPEAGSLSATFLRHYLPSQEKGGRLSDGFGSTEA